MTKILMCLLKLSLIWKPCTLYKFACAPEKFIVLVPFKCFQIADKAKLDELVELIKTTTPPEGAPKEPDASLKKAEDDSGKLSITNTIWMGKMNKALLIVFKLAIIDDYSNSE